MVMPGVRVVVVAFVAMVMLGVRVVVMAFVAMVMLGVRVVVMAFVAMVMPGVIVALMLVAVFGCHNDTAPLHEDGGPVSPGRRPSFVTGYQPAL